MKGLIGKLTGRSAPEPAAPAAPRGHIEKCVPCGGKGWWINGAAVPPVAVDCDCDHGARWVTTP